MADEQPIIIKKKGGHGGHHGGAWKVAYADFVTAMMALFIVLWLMNSSKPVQEAVGGYFRDPHGVAQKKGTAMGGAGETAPVVKKEDMAKLKQDLLKAMEQLADFNKLKKQVEMTVTPEGLKIELMEDPKGTFFENGKAQPTAIMQSLLKILSVQLGKLPNPLSIEGHTDSKPFSDSQAYGNWELSTDRANAARRLMQGSGLRPGQVVQATNFNGSNVFANNAPTVFTSTQGSVALPLTGATVMAAGDKVTISDASTGGTFVFTAPAGGSTLAALNTAIAGAVTNGTLSATVTGAFVAGQEVISETAGSGISVTASATELGPMVPTIANDTSTVYIGDGTTTGAANTNVTTTINALSSTALNLGTTVTLGNATAAQAALTDINLAITSVSAQRGAIGASVNRLTAAQGVISDQITNLQSAVNNIQNADIGVTVANMTQYNVLESTGVAALQQTNQAQQTVLKLVQ
jgi:chemotaxis protein MotB